MRLMGKQLQHYVPQFYLEGFQDPENPNCVWVYEKGVAEPRLQPIPVTAAELDFYSPNPLPPGQAKDTIEREVLARIESNAAYIIKRWRAEGRYGVREEIEEERMVLFIASLHARSPMFRRDVSELMKVHATEESLAGADDDLFLDAYTKSSPDHGMSREEMRAALRSVNEPGGISLVPTENFVLGVTFMMMLESLPWFIGRQWSFLKAPEGAEFVTSDSPLNVFTLTPEGNAIVNVGVGLQESELTLPISPHVALRMTNERAPAIRRVSTRVARDANRRCAYQAERYVYSSRRSRRLMDLVNSFSFTRKSPRFDPSLIGGMIRRRRFGRRT